MYNNKKIYSDKVTHNRLYFHDLSTATETMFFELYNKDNYTRIGWGICVQKTRYDYIPKK
jgi:hypothetical protein